MKIIINREDLKDIVAEIEFLTNVQFKYISYKGYTHVPLSWESEELSTIARRMFEAHLSREVYRDKNNYYIESECETGVLDIQDMTDLEAIVAIIEQEYGSFSVVKVARSDGGETLYKMEL